MIEDYLNAAIKQGQERAKILKGKISQPPFPIELNALHQICEDRIDQTINELQELLTNPLILNKDLIHERIRLFKRILADLSLLETTAIAALTRHHADDIALSKLVSNIHQEINFPIPSPTVTCLSREYFSINPSLRLLEVPLAESDFLLHLPDLYHEIAHLLIATRNNPKVTQYQTEYGKFLALVSNHFENERIANRKSTGPRVYVDQALAAFEYYWIHGWANEIFSDLFAIYTLGPAFAWAHFHLTAERGGDPYDIQFPRFMSHPPDQARMETMLIGLNLINMKRQIKEIQGVWGELINATGSKPTPLYRRACPTVLLEQAAIHALKGAKLIGCRIVQDSTSSPIHDMLNTAWVRFWANPETYHQWEHDCISRLKTGSPGP